MGRSGMPDRQMAQDSQMIMKTYIKQNKSNSMISNKEIFHSIIQRSQDKNQGATVIVPHVCNNLDLFGGGFAAQVAVEYPEVKSNYHLLGKKFLQSNLGHDQFIIVHKEPVYGHKIIFVNMIAQNGIRRPDNERPLNYAALVRSMVGVSQYIQMNTGFITKQEKIEIHAPRFGSGLAGGNWDFIDDLITDIWYRYPVYIYS